MVSFQSARNQNMFKTKHIPTIFAPLIFYSRSQIYIPIRKTKAINLKKKFAFTLMKPKIDEMRRAAFKKKLIHKI